MSKVIKLSGTFRTVGAESAPFTPTHDRSHGALDAGPGSSWARDRYEVYSKASDCVKWRFCYAYPTFEEAEESIAKKRVERDFMGEFLDQGPARAYRIVRSTGTCEVVA